VAPLHAREDQVVAGLQAEMDMRHQPRIAEALDQPVVDLGRIERGQAQPLQVGQPVEQRRHQIAEPRAILQVVAPRGQVDAGQHDLARAGGARLACACECALQRQRAARTAAERDDAERAAVVATLLHLEESPGMRGESRWRLRREIARPQIACVELRRERRHRYPGGASGSSGGASSAAQVARSSLRALPSTCATPGSA
jgi:hypothetical protein